MQSKIKKIVLLFSAILITFGIMVVQVEMVSTKEDMDMEQLIQYANQGDADAQRNLGVCYENGYGVKRDLYNLYKAKYYYDRARENK